MRAGDTVVHAFYRAPDSSIEALDPVRMHAIDHVGDGVIDRFYIVEISAKLVPVRGLVGSDLRGLVDMREDCGD